MKMRVKVWDDVVEIDVDQKSKTVWIAAGKYHGQYHMVTRSSPSAAADAWAAAAKYHSN